MRGVINYAQIRFNGYCFCYNCIVCDYIPIITSIINNHYQFKIRKLEADQQLYERTVLYKRKIFENYLKASGKCLSYADQDALKEYGEYYLITLMYAPNDIRNEMIHLHSLMTDYKWDEAVKVSEKIVPKIHELLQTM